MPFLRKLGRDAHLLNPNERRIVALGGGHLRFRNLTPGALPFVKMTPAASRAERMAFIAFAEIDLSRSLSARLMVGSERPVALATSAWDRFARCRAARI